MPDDVTVVVTPDPVVSVVTPDPVPTTITIEQGLPGAQGPPGPQGEPGIPIVGVPYDEWPPADPQPETLYLRLAP